MLQQKHKCILLGFYVIDKHKWHIIVEWKENDGFHFFFYKYKTQKCGMQKYSPPFTQIPLNKI